MAAPETFFIDLQNYLRISLAISSTVDRPGSPPSGRGKINVGENFGIRITVTNIAPNPSDRGVYIFNNVKVFVASTNFATPLTDLTANAVPRIAVGANLTPGNLSPGHTGTALFHMRALSNIGGIEDWFAQEAIAQVNVQADFDYNSYFRIFTPTRIFTQEIDPAV